MRVLEFGAVNLHHRVWVAEQRLGGGLNRPRLARSGRSQKEQRAERLAWRHQLRQIDLIDLRERKGGLILRHDALEEFQLEFTSLIASLPDVERDQSDFSSTPAAAFIVFSFLIDRLLLFLSCAFGLVRARSPHPSLDAHGSSTA